MAATGGHVAALRVLIKAGPGKGGSSSHDPSFDGSCVGLRPVLTSTSRTGGETPADLAAKKNHQEALKTILEVREGTPNSLNLEAHLWFKSVLCNFHFNSLIH